MAPPTVAWFEVTGKDGGALKEFYGGLFGWTFQDNDMGPMGIYSTFRPADGPGGRPGRTG